MGRWAQRRRSGGGPPPPAAIVQMILAENDGGSVFVDYSGNVTASTFLTTDFHTQTSDTEPDEIVQDGANGLRLNFNGDISGDTLLEYSGTTSGVLSPQAIELTPI